MSRVAFGFLWAFVFIMPWENYIVFPVVGSIPHLVGVVASAVGIIHILARRRVRPLSWFHVFTILFVFWAGLSSFWSIDVEATRTRFITYLQLAVLVWLIWEIAWSSERGRALLEAYVLGAVVAAVATVSNYLTGVSAVIDTPRFSALGDNPNYVGLTLALGLPMAWYLSLRQPRRRLAWTWQLYLPLGLTAILLTGSRGASLAALVALVIIPWTVQRLHLGTKVAVCALAIGSLVLATHLVPETTLERIGSTRADIADGHFGGRGAIWTSGLLVAQEHPFAGVGAGAYGPAVAPTLGVEKTAHQTFLAILVEDGVVGLLLFLTMVAAAMQPLRHLPALQRRFWTVLLAALAVGSLSAAWDYQKQFWFVLGMLAAQVALRPTGTAVSQAPGARPSPGRQLGSLVRG